MINYEVELFTAMFCWPEQVPLAISALRPDHFEDESWRKLFGAIQKTYDSGVEIDSLHVLDSLISDGMRESDAGELVSRALDGAPVRPNFESYIRKIRDKAQKRRIAALMENTKLRAEAGESADPIFSDTLQGIWDIQDDLPLDPVRTAKDISAELTEQAFTERSSPEETVGIPTGIHELDVRTTGIRAGEFWVAGALPGRGKTSLGLQIGISAASRGIPVLFFSMEMSAAELLRRAAGVEIGARDVRNTRNMSESNWSRFVECTAEIGTLPFFVDESSSLSPVDIAMRARVQIRRHGIKLIIVDYLQLIKSSGRELRERVGASANSLRQLSKQTGVPVIALSQLRRPSDLNDRPSMIDLKESGDIEAHAHTVLLIYMPTGDGDTHTGEDEIIIGKQRNGPIGAIPVYFDKRSLTFKSREIMG